MNVSRVGRWSLIWLVVIGTGGWIQAQVTNSWNSSTSGNWEDALSWSLDVPPAPGQTILIENHGWKAVAIGPNTALNFPQTLSIDALTVISPGTDTVNTVFLNYAGLQTPLAITHNLYVSNDTAMVILQSAVQAFGNFIVGGTVTHDVSSEVFAGNLHVLDGGSYNLTNGTLTAPRGNENIASGGQFHQAGGSNYCVELDNYGEFDLSGGQLVFPQVEYPGRAIMAFGNFIQSGGTVDGSVAVGASGVGGGIYQLSGGLLHASALQLPTGGSGSVPDSSSMIQTGGTNICGAMNVGSPVNLYDYGWFGFGSYLLTNGLLVSSNLTVNGLGAFSQYGGVHSNGSMILSQSDYFDEEQPGMPSYFYTIPGQYALNGGTFMSDLVSGQPGAFSQTAGLCQIASLQIAGGQYNLSGGQLAVSNIDLSSGANFTQTGGTVTQSGTLNLSDSRVIAGPGPQQFGELQLSNGGNTNSIFTLSPGASALHFANSSSLNWSNDAMLIISNWNGSLSGGGLQQVFFGNDATGLTSQQLNQIAFQNPAGVSAGSYPAVVLPSGEIIPDPAATSTHVMAPSLKLACQIDGTMQIQFNGAAGRTYGIETSTNTRDWTQWTNVFNTNGTFNVLDCGATNCPARFYRAVLQP